MNSCQEKQKLTEAPLVFAGTFHQTSSDFFFFYKGTTHLTTVSEIGIMIVHLVYFKNKIWIL